MRLTITGFAGANKAIHPMLLADTVGVDSQNQRPGRGDLRAWRAPLNVATVPAGRQAIYRMGRDTPSDTNYWLSSSGDADYARSFIAEDSMERTYWTDGVAPKWTDGSFGLASAPYPSAWRFLGVPAPDTAPTITRTLEGTGTVESRYYVTIWVNDRGELSAPSPVSEVVSEKGGSTFRVQRAAGVPAGPWGIETWRLYRTVTASSGSTDFYFVGEASAAAPYIDDNVSAVNELLGSATWLQPPDGLRGLKALWNGIMAGFVGKSLRFSVAYRPYAWPLDYELVLDDTIVALGVWQQNLIVLTTGRPWLVTGSDPGSMSSQQIELDQACVSKKSVVEFGHGVVWASPDGLTYMGQGGARVLTEGIFLREDWQALKPSTMVGGQCDGQYLVSYDPGGGRASLMISPIAPQGAFFMPHGFTASFYDMVQDALYLLNGGNVQRWDAGAAQIASFTSKTFRTPRQMNFSVAQVTADAYPVKVNLWANGTQRLTNFNVNNGNQFRLPSGFLADQWKVQIITPAGGAVQGMAIAESTQELQS